MSFVLRLTGVTTHNLKNLTLSLPKGKLICLTGPSGSGKSSLAFDTLYQEARRRYLKVLSLTEKESPTLPPPPPLKEAEGLAPAVGLEQKLPRPSPRATVGTLCGALNFLRLMYVELGQRKCTACDNLFESSTLTEIAEELLATGEGERAYVLAPLWQPGKEAFSFLVSQGYQRFFVDHRVVDLTEEELPEGISSAAIIVDRLVLKKKDFFRLKESLRTAASLSGGVVRIYLLASKETLSFSLGRRCPHCGFELEELRPEHLSFNHPLGACPACKGLGQKEGEVCPACRGQRLSPPGQNVFLGGEALPDLARRPLSEILERLERLSFKGLKRQIFLGLFSELNSRLKPLIELGLGRLSLYHPAPLLSLGELQRLRLASFFGERLSGCLYIFDEPGLGLTPKEKERVLFLLRRLVSQGNTVLIVEHDPLFIMASDVVLELGPGAGEAGGEVLFLGAPEELAARADLPSGAYLSGKERLSRRRRLSQGRISVSGIELPSQALLVLCGVSGAGKSRLLRQLAEDAAAILVEPALFGGRESLVVSYIGAFRFLRELLAATPEARAQGLGPAAFSPFTKEGRCPVCKGRKRHVIELKSLPPMEVTCEECLGTGFRREVLRVRYRGYHVAELLSLSVAEALRFFTAHQALSTRLRLLEEVGLGYLKLGQELTTLSGGERQRLTLARFLLAAPKDKKVLLFDVPTLGLHFQDIAKLLVLFDRLLARGFGLVVAENHPALVLLADELWELEEGAIVWQGKPKDWLESQRVLADFYRRYVSLVKLE